MKVPTLLTLVEIAGHDVTEYVESVQWICGPVTLGELNAPHGIRQPEWYITFKRGGHELHRLLAAIEDDLFGERVLKGGHLLRLQQRNAGSSWSMRDEVRLDWMERNSDGTTEMMLRPRRGETENGYAAEAGR